MKRNFEERLKALEDSLTAQDPVAIVEPVPGGYLLKTGEQKGAIVTMNAADMRNCVDMGFKEGLAGSPMRQHERDKHASRERQRYAKSLYELYRQGYKLGKAAM